MFMPLIKLSIRCVCTVTFSFLHFFKLRILGAGPLMSTWGGVGVDSKVKIPIRSIQCTIGGNSANICTLKSVQCYGLFFQFGGVGVNFHFFFNLK